jgi:hypothetical protein
MLPLLLPLHAIYANELNAMRKQDLPLTLVEIERIEAAATALTCQPTSFSLICSAYQTLKGLDTATQEYINPVIFEHLSRFVRLAEQVEVAYLGAAAEICLQASYELAVREKNDHLNDKKSFVVQEMDSAENLVDVPNKIDAVNAMFEMITAQPGKYFTQQKSETLYGYDNPDDREALRYPMPAISEYEPQAQAALDKEREKIIAVINSARADITSPASVLKALSGCVLSTYLSKIAIFAFKQHGGLALN